MLKKLMTININKKMPPSRIHSFKVVPVPLSLFTNGGSMMLTQKSDFLHKLQELVKCNILKSDTEADWLLLDEHGIIQQLLESIGVDDVIYIWFMDHLLHLGKSATSIHSVSQVRKGQYEGTHMDETRRQQGTYSACH